MIQAISKGVNLNTQKGILSVASMSKADSRNRPKKKPRRMSILITFDEVDLERTSQLHTNALVITCMISSFLVKRVMMDQGSRAKIMYLNL